MNELYQDLLNQNINNVKIIAIGKGQYNTDNSNWTEGNSIPIVVDPSPNTIWTAWGANQRDLFFLDSEGNYHTDFNITTWDYDYIYNEILGLLPSEDINGCTDPEACNYDETANADNDSCEYVVDCAGECGGDGSSCTDCEEGYTEIDGECYYQSDLDILQQFIDNSQEGENPPPSDLSPIELGEQEWEENRLIGICSSNSLESNCFMDYQLSGEIPDDIDNLMNLSRLHLLNNLLGNYLFVIII